MTIGLTNTLNTSRLSLFSQQTNIDIIGHNVANVNTPGYSRQVGVIQTTPPLRDAVGMRGTGVATTRIMNLYDRFIGMQLAVENSNQGRWQARSDALQDLERTFNETEDYGLLPVMGEFWNSWEDLADNPEGVAQRVSVVEKSKIMTATLNSMDTDLLGQERILNQKVENTVLQINNLTAQLADLNQKIADNELLGNDANDLRDRRHQALEQLAGMIDINYFEDEMTQVTVLTASGKALVQGVASYDLRVDYDADTGEPLVIWHNDTGAFNDSLTGGDLRGHLDSWNDLQAARDDLRELTAGIIFAVNRLHVQGYGLDGSTGNLFFNHEITVNPGSGNRGDGVLTFNAGQGLNGVDWANLKNYDDYQIQVLGDNPAVVGDFRVVDVSTGEEVAGVAVDTSVPNRIGISFNGYYLQIDYTTGPRAGDTFSLSFRDQAARTVAVNPVLENPVKIAAADNPLELPGNNGTALGIAQLQHQLIMASGNSTFNEFYSSLVGRIGSLAQTAASNSEHAAMVTSQLQLKQESVSGVSIDEEMTNLIRFQQAYQASAKIISQVDELMDAVLKMV